MKSIPKMFVKYVFNLLGLEVHRKARKFPYNLRYMDDQRNSLEEVLDHVLEVGFSPKTVIDVGVAYGTPALYTRFPDSKHFLIEPIIEFENHLKDICKKYDADYVLAAASDKPGSSIIGVTGDLCGSSLMYRGQSERVVPVVTLDDICEEKGLKGPYLLKADVQGAELKVLDGATNLLGNTEMVILEVTLCKSSENKPDFYDVVDYMKKHGFVAYEIFGALNRPLDGAQAQVDIIFVEEGGKFRKPGFWASPEQQDEYCRFVKV